MQPLKLVVCCGVATLCISHVNAQALLKKLKDKANTVAEKVVDKKIDDAIYGTNGNSNNSAGTGISSGSTGSSSTASSKNRPTNKGGQGLVTTPPNVKENLSSAETSYKAASYGEARYALQQAMLGVEMEIGQSILKSLPETVAGLKKDAASDQVTSTGWGWVGLMIHREYGEGDKQLRLQIANNAAWMQAVNLYLANGGYAQQTANGQKWKQIKVKGYRSVIEYDESNGYKLSIPLGQTSLIILEGINFANEQDMVNAANEIDIDGIKAKLGEK